MKAVLRKIVPSSTRQNIREAARDFIERDPEMDERRKFLWKAFKASDFNGIMGDYAEFGCHGCGTFSLAYQENLKATAPRAMWAFDSFQGLPPEGLSQDEHPQWISGAFAMGVDAFRATARSRGIPDSIYTIVPGFYEDTIGSSSYDGPLPEKIAIAYIDCDLYTSTQTVFSFLATRIKHGSILAFDDYFCYSGTRISGERRAFLEFQSLASHLRFLPYAQFGWHGMSFVVEDAAQLPTIAVRDAS